MAINRPHSEGSDTFVIRERQSPFDNSVIMSVMIYEKVCQEGVRGDSLTTILS